MSDKHGLLELFAAPLAGEWPRVDSVEIRQKLSHDSTAFHLILRLSFSEDAPYYDIEDWWRCLEAVGPSIEQCVAELTSDTLEVVRVAHARRVWQEEVVLRVGCRILLRGGPGGYGSAAGRRYRREVEAACPGKAPHFALPDAAKYSIVVPADTEGRALRVKRGYILVEAGNDQLWVPAWELRPGITNEKGVPIAGSETAVWLP